MSMVRRMFEKARAVVRGFRETGVRQTTVGPKQVIIEKKATKRITRHTRRYKYHGFAPGAFGKSHFERRTPRLGAAR